ncbi:MAG: L,D-transpeptidase family protein, partial [Myxococcota bacterium]
GDCSSDSFSAPPSCEGDFPNGHCTQACLPTGVGAWVCPDEDTSSGSPFSTTRCITDDADQPRCASACDFERSATGCRPGYSCVRRPRFGSTQHYPVCLPSATESWPGASPPRDDIGTECFASQDCEQYACLKVSGGYCTKIYCDTAGCPDSSVCLPINDDGLHSCFKRCDSDDECRSEVGQACLDGICFTNPTPPPHDPSVGAPDCAEAWTDGLHRCDAAPQYYLVVNKAARNLALCDSGALVEDYPTALGFAPVGDKEREGDGKTPEGVFYIARRIPNSQFHRAYLLSYPNEEDAARGLEAGLIGEGEATAIREALGRCEEPPQTTELGSLIEVHGNNTPGGPDWTWGCAALTDIQMDGLWPLLGVGDTIVVKP